MANELQTIENNGVSVNYRQAELTINGLDKLKKRVEAIAELYANRVYEEGDEKSLKADRSELKALSDGLDDARKNVKRQYNQPLKAFEKEIETLKDQIDVPLNNVRANLDEIDTKKRERNKQIVMDYIKQEGEVYEVEPEEIEFKSSWTNAGGFTEKLAMKKRLKEDVLVEIQNVAMTKKKAADDEQAIKKYCKEKGVDPNGWVGQLKYASLAEVMAKIDEATAEKPKPAPQPKPVEQPQPTIDKSEENIEIRTIELKGKKKFIETVITYAKAHGLEVVEKGAITFDDLPW